MIVILPKLNLEEAGFAYSMFFFFKAAWYFAAGTIEQKIGARACIVLSLIIQTFALIFIFHLPESPWLGRILEGIALSQGTISSLSLMRAVEPDQTRFSKAMSLVMGLGSLGFVIGPVSAFFVKKEAITTFGNSLCVASALFILLWWLISARTKQIAKPQHSNAPQKIFDLQIFKSDLIWAIVAVACIKSVVMGLQLNVGWWARELLSLSPTLAGLSFLVMSATFALGATLARKLPKVTFALIGLVAYSLLEIALNNHMPMWWTSLVLLGMWYGFSITVFYSKLGWNDEKSAGTQNATWLFLVDAPMALLPVLIWPTRAEIFSTERLVIVLTVLVLSSIGYLKTFGWDFHAPKQNSQS